MPWPKRRPPSRRAAAEVPGVARGWQGAGRRAGRKAGRRAWSRLGLGYMGGRAPPTFRGSPSGPPHPFGGLHLRHALAQVAEQPPEVSHIEAAVAVDVIARKEGL
eukprot:6254978-Prymnesium_polylepis.1